MKLNRREALAVGLGGIAAAALPFPALASTVEELTAEFAGGAEIGSGGITLTAPEIAENGNTVPISVDAPGATCGGQPDACGLHFQLRTCIGVASRVDADPPGEDAGRCRDRQDGGWQHRAGIFHREGHHRRLRRLS